MMVKDHSAANQELMSLAQSKGMKLPDGPGMGADATKMKLDVLSGETFDKSYVKGQIKAHRETVELLQKEISHRPGCAGQGLRPEGAADRAGSPAGDRGHRHRHGHHRLNPGKSAGGPQARAAARLGLRQSHPWLAVYARHRSAGLKTAAPKPAPGHARSPRPANTPSRCCQRAVGLHPDQRHQHGYRHAHQQYAANAHQIPLGRHLADRRTCAPQDPLRGIEQQEQRGDFGVRRSVDAASARV